MWDRILFAIFYALAGWQCWAQSDRLETLLTWLFSLPLRWRESCRRGAEEADDEAWVRKQMGEVRSRNALRGMEAASVILSVMLFLISMVWYRSRDPDYATASQTRSNACALLCIYALCLAFVVGGLRLTNFRLTLTNVLINVILIFRVMAMGATHMSHLMHSPRTLVQCLLGIWVLDIRQSLVVNVVWTVVLCHQQVQQSSELSQQMGTNSHRFAVLIELGNFCLLQMLLWLFEVFVEAQIRLKLGYLVARNLHQGMRQLLSVLCDAEVQLGPTLKISEPSHKVAHLLAPDAGVAGVGAIEGSDFMEFVAVPDQTRFQNLIGSSQDLDTEQDAASPASSIQLQLRDTTGSCFSVEIFHTKLANNLGGINRPSHLIGIRESEIKEATPNPLFTATQNLGPGPLPVPLGGPRPEDFAGSWGETSSHSSSSMSRLTVVQRMELPELSSIEIRCDPLCERMVIRQLACFFTSKGSGPDEKLEPPELANWVPSETWEGFKTWAQDQVNAAWAGNDPQNPTYGSLCLRWPSRSGGTEDELMIEAADVSLEMLEEEEEEEDSEEEEDEEEQDIQAVLKLRQFTQIHISGGRHRRSRMRRRERSVHRSAMAQQKLPSIVEALTEHTKHGSSEGSSHHSGGAASRSGSLAAIPEFAPAGGAPGSATGRSVKSTGSDASSGKTTRAVFDRQMHGHGVPGVGECGAFDTLPQAISENPGCEEAFMEAEEEEA